MNPYPLLLWLEEYGGSITGGMDASYCEAPQEEPAPNSSGTTPDLDTGDRNDARPSPIAEQNRDGQNTSEPERKKRTEEKSERTIEKSKETDVTGDETKASPAGSSAKDERSERSTPAAVTPAPDGDRTLGPSTDAVAESAPSQPEIRTKIRALLKDPRRQIRPRVGPTSRPSWTCCARPRRTSVTGETPVCRTRRSRRTKRSRRTRRNHRNHPNERSPGRSGPSAKPRTRIHGPSLKMLRLRKKTGRKASMRPSPRDGSSPRVGRDDRGGGLRVRGRAPLGGSDPLLRLPQPSIVVGSGLTRRRAGPDPRNRHHGVPGLCSICAVRKLRGILRL
jgi:hypothetical protein